MNQSLYAILLIIPLLLTTACKEEEEYVPIYGPGPQAYGKAAALKNDKAWYSSGYAERYKKENTAYFGILLDTYTIEGFHRENVCFSDIYLKKGSYELRKKMTNIYEGYVGAIYATLADDGDVLEDWYNLDEGAKDNYLEIIAIDTVEQQVEGRFTATFEVRQPKRNRNNPDRVKFSNGTFSVKIVK